MGKMMVCTENFSMDIDGTAFIAYKDITRVDEDHPAVKRMPTRFWKEVDLTYPVEAATAAPGEKRATAMRTTKKAEG